MFTVQVPDFGKWRKQDQRVGQSAPCLLLELAVLETTSDQELLSRRSNWADLNTSSTRVDILQRREGGLYPRLKHLNFLKFFNSIIIKTYQLILLFAQLFAISLKKGWLNEEDYSYLSLIEIIIKKLISRL